ncbi:MAG: carboxypeptidase-like regulatory domain-containing protein [Bryobacteraceae bacterium]
MLRLITTLLFLLATVSDSGWSQVLYGSIVGNVSDGSDAPIPGATVAIRNTQTGVNRETTTNDSGGYNFSDVSSGSYEVRITRQGFTPVMKTEVPVTINSVSRVNATLQVGSVTETVQISAQAAILQTDRSEVRAEVTTKSLENLPVPPGRNYQQIFRTLPGFSPQCAFHPLESHSCTHLQREWHQPEFQQHTHRRCNIDERATAMGDGLCARP